MAISPYLSILPVGVLLRVALDHCTGWDEATFGGLVGFLLVAIPIGWLILKKIKDDPIDVAPLLVALVVVGAIDALVGGVVGYSQADVPGCG